MKRVKQLPKSFPNDCWGCVIEYFESSNDFLNLVLSVKGLLEYIEKINPRCMFNVEFHMKKIPYEEKQHVVHLNCLMSDVMDGESIRGCPTFDHFLEGLSFKFPNIEKLRIRSKRVLMKFLDIHVKTSFLQLRSLDMVFHETKSLKISSKLPKLTNLNLTRLCETGSEWGFENIILNPTPNLIIDWAIIPKLRNLHLYGWSLKHPFPKKTKFEDLTLGCTRTIETSLSDSFRVRNLTIEDESLLFLKSIHSNRNLRKLELNSGGKVFQKLFPYQKHTLNINTHLKEIKDFPFLEDILLSNSPVRWELEEYRITIFYFTNLPSLKKFKTFQISFPLILSNTPNIEILIHKEALNTVDFKIPSDTFRLKVLEVEEADENSVFQNIMGDVLKRNISENKKLNNLPCLERLTLETYCDFKTIPLSGFPKLRKFVACYIVLSEVSHCPLLAKISGFTASPNFSIEGIRKLDRLRFTPKNSLYRFFESIRDVRISSVWLQCSEDLNFHLSPRNIRGIKWFDLEKINELIIYGDPKYPLRLTRLGISGARGLVKLENISRLWKLDCKNVYNLVVRNCRKLKKISLSNLDEDDEEEGWDNRTKMVELLELENLPSLRKMKVETYSQIKETKISELPPKHILRRREEEHCDDDGNNKVKYVLSFDLVSRK